MSDIKPIETRYKGYRFRSRLEARWAVFFDALNMRWEYEKEGFVLHTGERYLPDFWLPEIKLWIEVKGELDWHKKTTESGYTYYVSPQLDKCETFRDSQEWPVACIVGTPGEERIWFYAWDLSDSSGGCFQCDNARWYLDYPGDKTRILTLDVGAAGRSIIADNLCGIDMPWFEHAILTTDEACADGSVRALASHMGRNIYIPEAYEAARSARFEHGECG